MPGPFIYNASIPQAADLLSVSQGDIRDNFGGIKSLVDIDHVSFASADAGKHIKVTLPVQAPAPAFVAGEVGMYSFLNPTTNKNELYVNKTNNSGIVQIAATSSILGNANPIPGTFGDTTGWTMLPSGIKMVWGSFPGSPIGPQTINLVGAQQFGTTILSIQLTVIGTGSSAGQALARVRNISANSFQAVVSDVTGTTYSNSNVMFLALGY